MLLGREPLAGDREPPTGPVERIILAASVTERLVLDASSALIEGPVRQLDNMERVRNLGGVGEHRVEHRAIAGRQIERRPLDPVAPSIVTCGEPAARLGSISPGHDVEELSSAHVDDLGRPQLVAEPTDPGEQGLIEPGVQSRLRCGRGGR